MPRFDRQGDRLFDEDGNVRGQHIGLPGGSELKIYGGKLRNEGQFQIRFARDGGAWWMDKRTLPILIAELLHLNNDLNEQVILPPFPVFEEEDPFADEEEVEEEF